MTVQIIRPPKAGSTPTPTPTPTPTQASVPFVPNSGTGGGIPVAAGQFIPPNGFAGWAQQTPAVQSLFRRSNGGRKRRKTSRQVARAAPRKKRRAAAGKARLVKGSAAAKRYMAKLRKMRK